MSNEISSSRGYIERPEGMSECEVKDNNITKIRTSILKKNPHISIQNNSVFIDNLIELPCNKKTCENGNWGISDITGRKIKYENFACFKDKHELHTIKMSNDSYRLIFEKIKKNNKRNKYYTNYSLKDDIQSLKKYIISDADIILNDNLEEYSHNILDIIIKKKDELSSHSLEELKEFRSIFNNKEIHEFIIKNENFNIIKSKINEQIKIKEEIKRKHDEAERMRLEHERLERERLERERSYNIIDNIKKNIKKISNQSLEDLKIMTGILNDINNDIIKHPTFNDIKFKIDDEIKRKQEIKRQHDEAKRDQLERRSQMLLQQGSCGIQEVYDTKYENKVRLITVFRILAKHQQPDRYKIWYQQAVDSIENKKGYYKILEHYIDLI